MENNKELIERIDNELSINSKNVIAHKHRKNLPDPE